MRSACSTKLSTWEKLWRGVLLDPNARAVPFVVDLARRPAEAQMVRRRPVERSRVRALAVLFALASLFMANAAFEGLLGMGLIAAFLLSIVGVIALVITAAARMEWRASWQDKHVQVHDRRWGKTREWSAPYSEFEGVAVRTLVIGQSSPLGIRLPATYHLAELRHPDPLKTILIAASRNAAESERAASKAADALGLVRV